MKTNRTSSIWKRAYCSLVLDEPVSSSFARHEWTALWTSPSHNQKKVVVGVKTPFLGIKNTPLFNIKNSWVKTHETNKYCVLKRIQ